MEAVEQRGYFLVLKTLTKTAVVCGGAGLLGLFILLLSGAAYPDTLFRVLAPLSLLLCFAALPPLFGAWVLTIRRAWTSGSVGFALLWLVGGLLLLLKQFLRV